METSILIAQLLGPTLLAMGVGMVLDRKGYRTLAHEFVRSPALIYLAGLVTLPVGLAIVITHNVWVADWPVLITVFGWLAVIGGTLRIVIPGRVRGFGERMLAGEAWMIGGAVVVLVLGAVFTFFGYLA